MEKNILICPICNSELTEGDKRIFCDAGHSFDISKRGYVNLLTGNKANHGDNRQMIEARRDFLSLGYYKPFCDEICRLTEKYATNSSAIIDSGCGEGYYTNSICKTLKEKSIFAQIYGFDISKIAVDFASRAKNGIKYFAASATKMPFSNECADIMLCIFSPFEKQEFSRVLKKNGILIMAIPTKRHLFAMKSILYDTPYENETQNYDIDGFDFIEKSEICDNILLKTAKEISDLFTMTPYYYRTSENGKEKLFAKDSLETEIGFEILVYKKM